MNSAFLFVVVVLQKPHCHLPPNPTCRPLPPSSSFSKASGESSTVEIMGITLKPMTCQQLRESDSSWSKGSLWVRSRQTHALDDILYSEPSREINAAGSRPGSIKGNGSLSLSYLVLDSVAQPSSV